VTKPIPKIFKIHLLWRLQYMNIDQSHDEVAKRSGILQSATRNLAFSHKQTSNISQVFRIMHT